MKCPFCASEDSQVKDSRPAEDGHVIRRRRACDTCGGRFTTFERVQLRDVYVLKSGERRELFERSKLEHSIAIACRKRPVPADTIAHLASGIQRQLETSGENEIQARDIGAKVMDALKGLDSVAYIRFASVYKDFAEPQDFEDFAGTVKDAAGT